MNNTLENRVEYIEKEISKFQMDITEKEIELTSIKNKLWKASIKLAHRINNNVPLSAQNRDMFTHSDLVSFKEIKHLKKEIEQREEHLIRWLEGVKNIEQFIYQTN